METVTIKDVARQSGYSITTVSRCSAAAIILFQPMQEKPSKPAPLAWTMCPTSWRGD